MWKKQKTGIIVSITKKLSSSRLERRINQKACRAQIKVKEKKLTVYFT